MVGFLNTIVYLLSSTGCRFQSRRKENDYGKIFMQSVRYYSAYMS